MLAEGSTVAVPPPLDRLLSGEPLGAAPVAVPSAEAVPQAEAVPVGAAGVPVPWAARLPLAEALAAPAPAVAVAGAGVGVLPPPVALPEAVAAAAVGDTVPGLLGVAAAAVPVAASWPLGVAGEEGVREAAAVAVPCMAESEGVRLRAAEGVKLGEALGSGGVGVGVLPEEAVGWAGEGLPLLLVLPCSCPVAVGGEEGVLAPCREGEALLVEVGARGEGLGVLPAPELLPLTVPVAAAAVPESTGEKEGEGVPVPPTPPEEALPAADTVGPSAVAVAPSCGLPVAAPLPGDREGELDTAPLPLPAG